MHIYRRTDNGKPHTLQHTDMMCIKNIITVSVKSLSIILTQLIFYNNCGQSSGESILLELPSSLVNRRTHLSRYRHVTDANNNNLFIQRLTDRRLVYTTASCHVIAPEPEVKLTYTSPSMPSVPALCKLCYLDF